MRRVVLDVSSYQGNVDFARIKAESPEVVGVIIKATEGQWSDTNPNFEQQYASAISAGLLTGAYLFDHTSVPYGTEASLYLTKVQGKLWPLGHWLDFEANDANSAPDVVAQHVLHILQAIDSVHPGQAGIYTAPWAWNPWTGNANFSSYPLWLAGYTPSLPPSPGAWGAPVMWQFTDAYPTYFGGCDASVIWNASWPQTKDWFDMATVKDLQDAVRSVLNEGTAGGQKNWATTNQVMLSTAQGLANQLKTVVGALNIIISGGNGHPGLQDLHDMLATAAANPAAIDMAALETSVNSALKAAFAKAAA